MSAEQELAVRNLVGRYAHAVTSRDEAAWAATWTQDAEWHVIGMHAQGREAVVALWNKLIGTLPFVVQIPTGGVIELDGDRGTGRWTMREIGKDREGKGLFTLGIYRGIPKLSNARTGAGSRWTSWAISPFR